MAAKKRRLHMQEVMRLNDLRRDPNIGRRTGLPLNINARKGSDGFDIIDDYFPDSDIEDGHAPDESVTNLETTTRDTSSKHAIPEGAEGDKALQRKLHMQEVMRLNDLRRDPNIGRRTGLPLNINARKGSDGFDIIDDYFPDSDTEDEDVPPDEESVRQQAAITDESVINVETTTRDTSSEHATPEGAEGDKVSPDLTGSVMKTRSKYPTPQFEDTKKRLMFTTAKKVVVETEESLEQSESLPEQAAHSASESYVDVVGLDEDTAEYKTRGTKTKENSRHRLLDQQKAKTKKRVQYGGTPPKDEDDNASTFLTIGNVTKNGNNSTTRASLGLEELEDESFAMDESVVMEGTRHKSMSPELGTTLETLASQRSEESKEARPSKRGGKKQSKRSPKKSTKAAREARSVEDHEVNSSESDRSRREVRTTGRNRGATRKSAGKQALKAKNGAAVDDAVTVEDEGAEVREGEEENNLVELEKPTRTTRQTQAKRNEAAVKTRQRKSEGDGGKKTAVTMEVMAGLRKKGRNSVDQSLSMNDEPSAENDDLEDSIKSSEILSQDSCSEDEVIEAKKAKEEHNLVEPEKPTRTTRQTQTKRNEAAVKTRQRKSEGDGGKKTAVTMEVMAGLRKKGRNSVDQSLSMNDEPSAENDDLEDSIKSSEILSQDSCSEDEVIEAKKAKEQHNLVEPEKPTRTTRQTQAKRNEAAIKTRQRKSEGDGGKKTAVTKEVMAGLRKKGRNSVDQSLSMNAEPNVEHDDLEDSIKSPEILSQDSCSGDEGTEAKEAKEQRNLIELEKPTRTTRQTQAKRNEAAVKTRQRKSEGDGGKKTAVTKEVMAALRKKGRNSVDQTVSMNDEPSVEHDDLEDSIKSSEILSQDSCSEDEGTEAKEAKEQHNLVESEKPTRTTRQTQAKRNEAARKTRQRRSEADGGKKTAVTKEVMAGLRKKGRNSVDQSLSMNDEPSAENDDLEDPIKSSESPKRPTVTANSVDDDDDGDYDDDGGGDGDDDDDDDDVDYHDDDGGGGDGGGGGESDEGSEFKSGPDPVTYDLQDGEDVASSDARSSNATLSLESSKVEEADGDRQGSVAYGHSGSSEDANTEKNADKKPTASRASRRSRRNTKEAAVEDEQDDVEDRSVSNSPEMAQGCAFESAEESSEEEAGRIQGKSTRKRDSGGALVAKGNQRGQRNKKQNVTTDGAEEREGDVASASENVRSVPLPKNSSGVEVRHSASDMEDKEQSVHSRKRNKNVQAKSKRGAKDSIDASYLLDEAELPVEDEVASPKRQRLEKEQETSKESITGRRKNIGKQGRKMQRLSDASREGNDSICEEIPAANKNKTAKARKGRQAKPPQKKAAVQRRSSRESNADSVTDHRDDPQEHAQGGTPAGFNLPSVTATKSILKSSGTRKRTSGPSRTLRIVARGSGSDADDESYATLPQVSAKKRMSSVSFAPTPTIHLTPNDTNYTNDTNCTNDTNYTNDMEQSGLSGINNLSFVTINSSVQFTDASFTPGSATSRVSSSSSSSDASPQETSIDDSQEVTLLGEVPRRESGVSGSGGSRVRRSKRTKVPPLKYWEHERIDYERRMSGGWRVKGVIKNPTPPPKKRQKRKNATKKTSRQTVANVADDEDVEPEEVNTSAMVINPDNIELVSVDLFHTPQLLNFVSATANGDPPQRRQVHVACAVWRRTVRPQANAAKGKQHVRNDTMLFFVIHGVVEVTVHHTSIILRSGSTFFVPQGNAYDIKNCTQKEARLFFIQIKG